MGIQRVELPFEGKFTQVPNEWVRDERLSRRARGLLVELLSHRAGWRVTVAALQKAGTEGRDAVRKTIDELQEFGYLTRTQGHRETGKFSEVEYVLTSPGESDGVGFSVSGESLENSGVADLTVTDIPTVPGKPSSVLPTSVNPHPKNTSYKEHDSLEELLLVPAVVEADLFAEFWKLWPRGEGKAAAVKAWSKASAKVSPDVILAAAARYVSSPDRPEAKFVPYAASWLNQERWADDGLAPASGGDKQARALALVGKYELEERRAEVGSGEVVGLVPGRGSSGAQRALGRGVV